MADSIRTDAAPSTPSPRQPQARPPLAYWIWSRGYTWAAAGALFGVTGEAVRKWCLPFGDRLRQRPRPEQMPRIVEMTGGEITAVTFDDPSLMEPAR